MVLVMVKKGNGASQRGKHRNPRSLQNLKHEGRPLSYSERKERHNVSVTPQGWNGVEALASETGRTVSGLLESFGRGELDLRLTIAQLMSQDTLAKLNLTSEQREGLTILEVLHKLSQSVQS